MKYVLLIVVLLEAVLVSASPMVREGLQNVESALADEVVHAYQEKDYPKMRRVTGLLLKAFPQSRYGSHALYWMARLLIEDEKIDEGLFVLEKLESHYPKSERARLVPLMRTVAFGKKGDWDKAQKTFRDSRAAARGIRK